MGWGPEMGAGKLHGWGCGEVGFRGGWVQGGCGEYTHTGEVVENNELEGRRGTGVTQRK